MSGGYSNRPEFIRVKNYFIKIDQIKVLYCCALYG